MFHNSTVMLLNKVDLLPYLEFDLVNCLEMARRVNPEIVIFQLSARTGQGMEEWYGWLREQQQIKAGTKSSHHRGHRGHGGKSEENHKNCRTPKDGIPL